MLSNGTPRVAKLEYYRHGTQSTVLVAKVTKGPKSEMGRTVHVPVSKADLPMLREMIAKLEQ
jgi:hypothetical protein